MDIDNCEFEKQRSELKKYLSECETGKNEFVVLNNEAGFGKSRITDSILINDRRRCYLLVKKYNDEKKRKFAKHEGEYRMGFW